MGLDELRMFLDDRFIDLMKEAMTEDNVQKRAIRVGDRIFPVMQMRKQKEFTEQMINAIGESCNWDPNPSQDQCFNHWLPCSSARSDLMAQAMTGFDSSRHDLVHSSSMLQYSSLYRMKQNGSYIFDLSHDISKAFMETECRMPGDMAKIPCASFYVAVPRTLNVKLYDDDGRGYILDGVHASLVEWDKYPLYGSRTINEEDETIIIDSMQMVHGYGMRKLSWSVRADQIKSLHCVAVALPDVGSCMWDNFLIDFPVPLSTNDIEKASMSNKITSRLNKNTADGLHQLVRIVINTLMYMATEKPDIVRQKFGPSKSDIEKAKGGDKAARKRVAESTVKVSYFRVGDSVRLCSNTRKHLEQSEEGKRLTSGHMVRGHWRTIAHGKGKTERSPRYIQPHWRGPSFDEVIARLVKVR